MSETAEAAAVATQTPASTPAPEAQTPSAPTAPPRLPGAAERMAAQAILDRARNSDGGKPDAPTAPAPAAPPVETAPDATEAPPEPAPSKPAAPPEPPKPRKPSPYAEARIAARKLEAERQTSAAERAKLESERAAAEQERAQLAAERQRVANADELKAARYFLRLFTDRPDEAIRAAAQMTGQKPEDIMRRIAERGVDGPGADDAQRAVAAARAEFDAKLAAERYEREKFIAAQKAREDEISAQRQAWERQARERDIAAFAEQLAATGSGLESNADAVLQRQASNLPFTAYYSAAASERVRADAHAAVAKIAAVYGSDWRPTPEQQNEIALRLEEAYRREYEAVQGIVTRKSKPAAPLGSAAQVPGDPNKTPVSANGNGSPQRADIAAASGNGMRAGMSLQERRVVALRMIDAAKNAG